jgi:cytoskeletal protein CcmA (bactofilin family)
MYDLERETTNYQEVTKAQPSAGGMTEGAGDINQTFELWLDSLSEATPPNCEPVLSLETEQRAETPLPSATSVLLTGCELLFKGTLHVDGYFAGSLRSDHGTLVLEEGGEINTDIIVGVARINGTVVGNIKAREGIELGSTARVIGDLHTPALTVEPGALFEGKCYLRTASVNGNGGRRRKPSRPIGSESSGLKPLRARLQTNGRKTQKTKPRRS